MFGATGGDTAEPANTLFADDKSAGTTHWVEWQTSAQVTLRSFNLVAAHDGSPRDINYRGFDTFNLLTSGDGTTWSSIYTYATDPDGDDLYGGGATYTGTYFLELAIDLSSPVISQYFRAEFVQTGGPGNASGPRILELDGYNTLPGWLNRWWLRGSRTSHNAPVWCWPSWSYWFTNEKKEKISQVISSVGRAMVEYLSNNGLLFDKT